MTSRVLVTGYKGFVGSALTAALRRSGEFEIIGVTRSEGMDLCDPEILHDLPDVDKIVHLAGSVGVPQSWDNPWQTYRNNITATLTMLEFARRRRRPVIYMSSYLYGPVQYLPVDEAHPINCGNPYARSKRQAEMLCQAYADDFGVPVTILRPFNLYGPGQSTQSLIPHVITQAREKDAIRVKDLEPKRDYLFIDDLVDAILQVIHSEQNESAVYNLGFGQSFSVRQVIEMVMTLTGKRLEVYCSGRDRPNEIMDCYSDSRKFSRRFDWRPRVNLEEGLSRILRSYELVGSVAGQDERD